MARPKLRRVQISLCTQKYTTMASCIIDIVRYRQIPPGDLSYSYLLTSTPTCNLEVVPVPLRDQPSFGSKHRPIVVWPARRSGRLVARLSSPWKSLKGHLCPSISKRNSAWRLQIYFVDNLDLTRLMRSVEGSTNYLECESHLECRWVERWNEKIV